MPSTIPKLLQSCHCTSLQPHFSALCSQTSNQQYISWSVWPSCIPV